ncbi:MAG: ABC transporter permease [Chloroflexi bacterium]|nr:ABC transporter permease [Chloroflexota bacterium]
MRRVRRVVRRHPLFVLALIATGALLAGAIFAPALAPYPPDEINFAEKLDPPSRAHLFGTDALGQDIFSRSLYGARTSLAIGGLVIAVALALGVPLGLAAGYFGGRTDEIIMRLTDVMLGFPPLLLPMAIAAALGGSVFNAMVAIAISWFPWYVRLLRAEVLVLRQEAFVEASRALGAGSPWILWRHLLPNAMAPVIVQASMDIGYAILAAASLSFIGLGAQPPAVEWGLMVTTARVYFLDFWWTATFPGLAIFVAVLAFNLLGDGLRDLLDPRLK